MFSKIDYSATPLKEFKVYGCKKVTPEEPQPQIFVSTVFAKNAVIARSKFSRLLNKQFKIKPSRREIIKTEIVPQDDDFKLKNYGIHFVFRTKAGLQNGYKEVRHINRVLAVSDMFRDFCCRHKIRSSEVYIYKLNIIKDEDVRRTRVLPFVSKDVQFPVFFKVPNNMNLIVSSKADIFN